MTTTTTERPKSNLTALDTAATFIRLFRQLSADLPIQQAEILLHTAMRPRGITLADLTEITGLSLASVSRNIAAMSKFHRLGKPGLNLLETIIDPLEPRRRLVLLTQDGKTFITKLIRTFEPSFSLDSRTDALAEAEAKFEELKKAEAAKKPSRGQIGQIGKL